MPHLSIKTNRPQFQQVCQMKRAGMILVLAGMIFYSTGDRFNRADKNIPSRQPYEVVSDVQLSSGVGRVILNVNFQQQRHNVVATSKADIFPSVSQILYDTSMTVRYYGFYISDNLETLLVKSSSATDTSTVRVRILMR